MFRPLKPRQIALDVGIALFCVLLALGIYALTAGPLSVVTLLGMAAALAIRRLSPALALAVAWVTALVQVFAGGVPEPSNLAVLPVLFATSAYGSRPVKWLGFASTFVGAATVSAHLVVVPALQQYQFSALLGRSTAEAARVLLAATVMFVGCLVLFLLSWVLGLLAKTYSSARASGRAQAAADASRAAAERETLVEQERTRIARDMHDVVAHSLAVVIAQADGARYARAVDETAVDEALRTIASTARTALGEVRVLLGQLRDDAQVGPQPGLADLDTLFGQMRSAGLRLVVDEVGARSPLPAGQQLAIYRIVQEALTNALRHGDRSAAVQMTLEWTADVATVTISNVRLVVGTTSEQARQPSLGHGLAGMRERALLAGGGFSVEGTDDRFTVRADLPIGVTGAVSTIASRPDEWSTPVHGSAASVASQGSSS